MEIGKTFCGRTNLRTDGRTDTPEFQSTRSSAGDDLKIEFIHTINVGRSKTAKNH